VSALLGNDVLAFSNREVIVGQFLRISMLISSGKLSAVQFQNLMTRADLQIVPRFQTMFTRHTVQESLKLEGLTPLIFSKIQHSQDKYLHEMLLIRADVRREHLLWLLEHGSSKAIRNRVKQLLVSKRFLV
jgi:hypothetical protein